jgi:hypothetical protein
VTNVRNGVARIVDRGPYGRGRVIDVSRACGCLYLLTGRLVFGVPIRKNQVKKLAITFVLLASSAFAQNAVLTEPVCEPIGRTSKGDLVFSMECRNIPGLPPGDKPVGYNPSPKETLAPQPAAPKAPESK